MSELTKKRLEFIGRCYDLMYSLFEIDRLEEAFASAYDMWQDHGWQEEGRRFDRLGCLIAGLQLTWFIYAEDTGRTDETALILGRHKALFDERWAEIDPGTMPGH